MDNYSKEKSWKNVENGYDSNDGEEVNTIEVLDEEGISYQKRELLEITEEGYEKEQDNFPDFVEFIVY